MTEERAERAHVRIGNRTFEAILQSTMTNRQKVICFGLIRVTAGWRQASATMTVDDFALVAGMNGGGTFRSALKELETEGVILTGNRGATTARTYQLQPDFTEWGKWSVAPNALKRRFGTRYESADSLIEASAQLQAESGIGQDPPSARPQADTPPTHSQNLRLPAGDSTPSIPPSDNDLDPRKDRKDRKDKQQQQTTADDRTPLSAPVSTSPEATYALAITTAANAAVTRKWGEQTRPYFYGMSTQLAAELVADKIPLAIAVWSITDQIDRSKATRPPSTISYFRNGILDHAKTDEQRRLDRLNPVTIGNQPQARGGQPTSLAYSLEPVQQERLDHAEAARFDAERRQAVREWADKPENASQVAAIHAAAKSAAVMDIHAGIGKRAYESDVIDRIAAAANFPTFNLWKSAQPAKNVSV